MKRFINSWRDKVGIVLIVLSSYNAIISLNILHFIVYGILITVLFLKYESFVKRKNILLFAILVAFLLAIFRIASIFIFGIYYFVPDDIFAELGANIVVSLWTPVHCYFAMHTFMWAITPIKCKKKVK